VASYLCDVNVWFALQIGTHPHHSAVRDWVGDMSDTDTLVFCRATQQSFLRLLTTAGVMALYGEQPKTNSEAWQLYGTTLTDSRIVFEEREPPGLESLWRSFALRQSPSPKLWMDAYIAAFAVAADLRFATTDTGFRQFEGLDLLILE
jgi:toxin-antitoxin system PIN domain toxin